MLDGSCHCGQVEWTIAGTPPRTNACNCTLCRRYAALWAYGIEDEHINVSGMTQAYVWGDKELGFHFCPTCGCLAYWRAGAPDDQGRRSIAVNLRLAAPDAVAHIPVTPFDGLTSFAAQPQDGRCIRDYWP